MCDIFCRLVDIFVRVASCHVLDLTDVINVHGCAAVIISFDHPAQYTARRKSERSLHGRQVYKLHALRPCCALTQVQSSHIIHDKTKQKKGHCATFWYKISLGSGVCSSDNKLSTRLLLGTQGRLPLSPVTHYVMCIMFTDKTYPFSSH